MNKFNKFNSQILYRLLLNRRGYKKSSEDGFFWFVPAIVAGLLLAAGAIALAVLVMDAVEKHNKNKEETIKDIAKDIAYKENSDGTIEIACYEQDCSSGVVAPEPLSILGTALAGGGLAYFKKRRSLKKEE